MKISNIKNVDSFLEAVKKCNGDVYLITEQGDHLNLKSQLTTLIAMEKIFDLSSEIGDIEIKANQDDCIKLMQYLVTM